jgi:hypothetical protein
MYVRICVCMYVCMYVRTYVCMYLCLYACMYACMHSCTNVCVSICVCMLVCMHVFKYVHMCVLMYVDMYVCMYCILRQFTYMYVLNLYIMHTCIQNLRPPIVSNDKTWHTARLPRHVVEAGKEYYVVPQGPAVEHFFTGTGPPSVVLYNWNIVTTPSKRHHIFINIDHKLPQKEGVKQRAHHYADLVTLNDIGVQQLKENPNHQVYKLELACSGRPAQSYKGTGTSNCVPVTGATSSRHELCKSRVSIIRKAQDVHDGNVVIMLNIAHVPEGVVPQPPPLVGLRPDKCLVREAAELIVATPRLSATDLIQQQDARSRDFAAKMNIPFEYNSRFIPDTELITNAAKRVRRETHTSQDPTFDFADDWEQCNQLVRRHLINSGDVIYYEEFRHDGKCGMIVCSPLWARVLMRDAGQLYACTDSKHDTTRGKSFLSSLRVLTLIGSFCTATWLSPTENTDTIAIALEVLGKNVPCLSPDCLHEVKQTWNQDGTIFSTQVMCANPVKLRPAVGHDKHVPTFNAVARVQWGPSLLDPWHAFRTISDYMTKVCMYCMYLFIYVCMYAWMHVYKLCY